MRLHSVPPAWPIASHLLRYLRLNVNAPEANVIQDRVSSHRRFPAEVAVVSKAPRFATTFASVIATGALPRDVAQKAFDNVVDNVRANATLAQLVAQRYDRRQTPRTIKDELPHGPSFLSSSHCASERRAGVETNAKPAMAQTATD